MTKKPPHLRYTQFEKIKTRIFENSEDASVTIAMEIADFESCQKHLEESGARIVNINLRPDGARQIFIEDPDRHVVEFCYLPPELR